MVLTIAIIVLFGLLLMMLETFVPGWIAGGLGVLCLITAVVLALTSPELGDWPAWGRTLLALGMDTIDDATIAATLGVVLKHQSDQQRAASELRLN